LLKDSGKSFESQQQADPRESMFPAVPDSISLPAGSRQSHVNNSAASNPTDSFDDLTNRFNQLKKH
jgi:hypothetical protein